MTFWNRFVLFMKDVKGFQDVYTQNVVKSIIIRTRKIAAMVAEEMRYGSASVLGIRIF